MGKSLKDIFGDLDRYFSEFRVVSQEEIALAVSQEVAKLDDETRKRLEAELHGDLLQVLVGSIVAEPISIYSPNLTSKRNYLGETFYHYPTHEFLADELKAAFKRLTKIRAMGKMETMEDIVGAFLRKSGYEVAGLQAEDDQSDCREMRATKGDRGLTVYIIPSVNFAPEHASSLKEGREYAIVVPTENTPAPFIHFCREGAADFQGKKIEMWVVDTDKKTVNPFLGYTRDDDLYRNFENPRLASFACRMYGVGKDLWVRSS